MTTGTLVQRCRLELFFLTITTAITTCMCMFLQLNDNDCFANYVLVSQGMHNKLYHAIHGNIKFASIHMTSMSHQRLETIFRHPLLRDGQVQVLALQETRHEYANVAWARNLAHTVGSWLYQIPRRGTHLVVVVLEAPQSCGVWVLTHRTWSSMTRIAS